jgi:methylenetetrahydrofolate--tRNA-(uracil-5-)-methyltransferase
VNKKVTIIGAGLAGSEAAYQLAAHGFHVELIEMRPIIQTEAHKTPYFAELVCSNSLKSTLLSTSSGLLKEEMRLFNSLIVQKALEHAVPAGHSLAVDRINFSKSITAQLEQHKNINIVRREVCSFDEVDADYLIVATGPLTSKNLSNYLQQIFGEHLYFYDAIAPVVSADSIDYAYTFFASRYGKGEPDYLNCPLNKDEFDNFYNALISANLVAYREFEDLRYFEACLPIEELARRGKETLRYGPLKPVGLTFNGKKPYAVLQLRKENEMGTSYNLVGCQTRMLYGEQKKAFACIPALKNAEYLRLGSMHRNTYIASPKILGKNFTLKNNPNIYIVGQLTGVEGYMPSAASGLIAALVIIFKENNMIFSLPSTTALYAISNYHLSYSKKDFVPSNFHFDMLPPLGCNERDKRIRKLLYSMRALDSLKNFLNEVALPT